MRRWLLFSMFLVLFADTALKLKLGFGTGLSIKNMYLYTLCMLLAIDTAMKPGDVRLVDLDVLTPFVLLIAYATLTWFVKSTLDPSYDSLRGLVTMKNQLVDFLLFFILFRFGPRTREDFMWLLRAVVGVLAASSVFTLMDFLNLPDFGIVGEFKGRVEGPMGAANQYGALLVFLLPLIGALTPRRYGLRKMLWYFCLAASFVLLLATGSRGAFVSLAVAAVFSVILLRHYLNAAIVLRWAAVGVLALFAGGVIILLTSGDVVDEVVRKTFSGSVEEASSGRLEIWTAFFRVMLEWPASYLVGYGWNTADQSGIWKSAHSVYIDTWYELGILGVILLVWLYLRLLFRTPPRLAQATGTEASIQAAYVFGLTGLIVAMAFVKIPQPATIFWMISGLVVGLQHHVVEAASEPARPPPATVRASRLGTVGSG